MSAKQKRVAMTMRPSLIVARLVDHLTLEELREVTRRLEEACLAAEGLRPPPKARAA